MRACYRFSAPLLALLTLYGCSEGDKPTAVKAPAPAPVAEAVAAPPPSAPSSAAPAATEAVFSAEELDQMLAPLALYPDPLLAQVLMAATYPGNVADAAAWSMEHPDASGDEAVRQVANQPWDPSVQSLVAFPAALATLGQDPAWVQRVGDAFLAQPDAVMDSVQRLRRQAKAAGNLESNEQQRVSVQPAAPAESSTVVQAAAPTQTIIIEPATPQVVYVPSYNPTVVYGTWPYPSSPPVYYPPPPGYYIGNALAAGLAFGVGVAIVDSLWGDCDWGRGDIDIDVDRYNNINVNRQINANQNRWQHNSINRNGVPYRDRANREQFSRELPGRDQRDAFRGHDATRANERERARQSLQQRGIEAPANTNLQARERAQAATRELRNEPQLNRRAQQPANGQVRQRAQAQNAVAKTQRAQHNPQVRQQARQQHAQAQAPRNNAFAGARNPTQARANASRGHASQAAASRPQSARMGQPVQRPSHSSARSGARRR